jgi:hypothetical protein
MDRQPACRPQRAAGSGLSSVPLTTDAAVLVNNAAYPPDAHISGDVVESEKEKRKASADGETNTPQQARQKKLEAAGTPPEQGSSRWMRPQGLLPTRDERATDAKKRRLAPSIH